MRIVGLSEGIHKKAQPDGDGDVDDPLQDNKAETETDQRLQSRLLCGPQVREENVVASNILPP